MEAAHGEEVGEDRDETTDGVDGVYEHYCFTGVFCEDVIQEEILLRLET